MDGNKLLETDLSKLESFFDELLDWPCLLNEGDFYFQKLGEV